MSTMAAPHQPIRKESFLRHKLRESFRPSAFRDILHHSEKDASAGQKPRISIDAKRPSMEEASWIARKRRKSKMMFKDEPVPVHTLEHLKIDVGGFEELKLSLDIGSEMYNVQSPNMPNMATRPATVRSPVTVATSGTKEGTMTFGHVEKPLLQKLNQYSPVKEQKMTLPQAMELEDASNTIDGPLDPMDIDLMPPPPKPQAEVRRGSKWQVKTDALVRPVSSGKASALSANVSSTIAAINTNKFGTASTFHANVDTMASTRQSMESTRSKMTSQTIYTDKVDSVMDSNASVSTTYSRRPLGDTAHTNTNRHSIVETDKPSIASTEQENKRQSFPPVAARRQSFVNMHAAQTARPKSPTASIASTATGFPRARRESGTNVASRLSWMQELENKNKASSQDPTINKLQGSVADKLRRFESQGSQAVGSSVRSSSATRSVSASRRGSELYGIEAGGKRLSMTVTHDEEFRKKLEEQFSRKQKEDEEREQKKNNRTGVPATTRKTSQPYTEATAASFGSRLPNAVFQGASAALKSTTNLLEGISKAGLNNAVKATAPLERTMSVQQKSRKVSPSSVKSARPVSYATPTPMSMDDEYDPFNYAVYPSRSSMYSNPPGEPIYTPATEYTEDELMEPVVEESPVKAASRGMPADASEEAALIEDVSSAESSRQVDILSGTAPVSEELDEIPARPIETPKAAPQSRTNTWGSRFTATPAVNPTTGTALPSRLHGGASQPAALTESATSSPRQSMDDEGEIVHVELVAREAVPASPTLVNIPSSKRSTPVKERFLADLRPVTPSPLGGVFNAAALPRLA